MSWWKCPNGTCEHGGGVHDIYEPGDPYPTCCVDGCPCGHPGEAVLRQHADGRVTVQSADPVIRVSRGLLLQMELDGSGQFDRANGMLRLDTAGEHVYEYLRRDERDGQVAIFGRVRS